MFGSPGTRTITDWYFDSVGGSDSNTGTTPGDPKRTLASVNGILLDGSTLHLKRGSRFKETFDVNGKKLNFIDYGTGNKPLIDGSLVLDNSEFSATEGYANVYQIPISYLALDGSAITDQPSSCSVQFFDGVPTPYSHGTDNRLKCANAKFDATFSWVNYGRTHVQNLEYVRDNPGSFYVSTTGGAVRLFPFSGGEDQLILYVHLVGNVNPITSGVEYSIGSNKHWVWYQRAGGTLTNIWWARWSFQNYGRFERCTLSDCEWTQAARHGPFFNDCVAHRCQAEGIFAAGAPFHAYRSTSLEGTSSGNVYNNCDIRNGQWGFYSHGSGGPTVSVKDRVNGGTVTNVVFPVQWETSGTSEANNLTCYDVETAIGPGSPVTYTNCVFHIKRNNAADPPSSGNSAVFWGASNAHLINCTIDGGDATRPGGGTRRLANNVGTGVVVENSTVTTAASAILNSAPITVINSVWPGT